MTDSSSARCEYRVFRYFQLYSQISGIQADFRGQQKTLLEIKIYNFQRLLIFSDMSIPKDCFSEESFLPLPKPLPFFQRLLFGTTKGRPQMRTAFVLFGRDVRSEPGAYCITGLEGSSFSAAARASSVSLLYLAMSSGSRPISPCSQTVPVMSSPTCGS